MSQQGPLFSLNAKKAGNKFISHLLGLDHEHPSGAAGSAEKNLHFLKGVKFTDFFQGIKFTPNFLFLLLFMGFFCWVFVIYWIRHNEPLANQVLGTPRVDTRKAAIDLQVVSGIKQAFPVQTTKTTGEIYVPGSPVNAMEAQMAATQKSAETLPTQQQGTTATQPGATVQVNPAFGQAQTQQTTTNFPASQAGNGTYGVPPQAAFNAYATTASLPSAAISGIPTNVQGVMPGRQGTYIIGIQNETGGTRARTVVSR